MTELIVKYYFQNKKDKTLNHLILPTHKYKIFSVGELTALFLTNGLADEYCHFRFKDQLESNIVWVDIKNESAPLPISKLGEIEIKILKVPYICDHRGLKKAPRSFKVNSQRPTDTEKFQKLSENKNAVPLSKPEDQYQQPKGEKSPNIRQQNEYKKIDTQAPFQADHQYSNPNKSLSPKTPLHHVRSNLSSQERQNKNQLEDIELLKSGAHRPHSNNVETNAKRDNNRNFNPKDYDFFNDFDALSTQKSKVQPPPPKSNSDFEFKFEEFDPKPAKSENSINKQQQTPTAQAPKQDQNEFWNLDFDHKKSNKYFGTTRDEELIHKEQKMQAGNLVDPIIKNWAYKNNIRKDLRTLLSTLHEVLWPDSQNIWEPVQLADILSEARLKETAFKAIVRLHPDKHGDCSPHKLYILDRVSNEINLAFKEYKKLNAA